MSEEKQTNEETVDEVKTEEHVSTTTNNEKKKSGGKGIWVIIIILIVLAGGFYALNKFGFLEQDEPQAGSVDTGANASAVVATVNGVTISRGELDEKINQVKQSLPEGSQDPTEDAAFELQLLEDIIDLKLLTIEAEKRDYTVTDDEIAAEKTTLIEQFGGEDAFKAQLETLGITEEELDKNMRDELRIRQLLEDETAINDIEVTDEEIQTTYDTAVSGAEGQEAPPLEAVREMIRSELVNQKSATLVSEYLEELRATAEIEKTL